jgi:ribosomal silencing factor RsfS
MKKIIILAVFLIALGVYLYQQKGADVLVIDLPPAQEYQDFDVVDTEIEKEIIAIEESVLITDENEDENIAKEENEEEESVVLDAINLAVPFTSQAPTSNWQQPFQDACEEASVLMVDYYYKNKAMPDPEEVEYVLSDMVAWQVANWGDHHNLTMQELADFIITTFGYQTELIPDLTPGKVKVYLDLDQPVIIPANGHLLANPYFSGNGPEYHMLVIKGYQDEYFITNDPGTKRGEDFVYTSENLFSAIADWNQKESLATGPQIGLVIIK